MTPSPFLRIRVNAIKVRVVRTSTEESRWLPPAATPRLAKGHAPRPEKRVRARGGRSQKQSRAAAPPRLPQAKARSLASPRPRTDHASRPLVAAAAARVGPDCGTAERRQPWEHQRGRPPEPCAGQDPHGGRGHGPDLLPGRPRGHVLLGTDRRRRGQEESAGSTGTRGKPGFLRTVSQDSAIVSCAGRGRGRRQGKDASYWKEGARFRTGDTPTSYTPTLPCPRPARAPRPRLPHQRAGPDGRADWTDGPTDGPSAPTSGPLHARPGWAGGAVRPCPTLKVTRDPQPEKEEADSASPNHPRVSGGWTPNSPATMAIAFA